MKRVFSILLLIASLALSPLVPTGAVFGQSSDYYELVKNLNRAQVYASSAVLPAADGGGQVGISFRIPHALLYFVQSRGQDSGQMYRAEVEVEVGVYQDGRRVAQKIWQKEPIVSSYESAEAQFEDVEGAVWFRLEPGTYEYRVEVIDAVSEQRARTRRQELTVPEPNVPAFMSPVLAENVSVDGERRTVEMYTLSGDVAFGQDAWAVIPLVLPSTVPLDSVRLRTALRRVEADVASRMMKRRRSRIVRPRLDGLRKERPQAGELLRADTLDGHSLVPLAGVRGHGSKPGTFVLEEAEIGQETNRYALILDLNGKELENEHFTFNLSVGTPDEELDRHAVTFASHWRERPFSLYDLDLAIDHLSFMARPEVLDRLDAGTAEEREQKFEEFWKERDPTPRTPFNELMAEYYRRVDHAADEFRTELKPVRAFNQGDGSVPDGLKSDRARVYIVHGAPSTKERQNPRRGLVREKWNYEDGRTFIFEALSKFDPFRLVEKYKYAGR